jgi:mannose-1-phosphate guanylyltransferase/mannose-6-phosphate isomerase
MQMGTGTLFGKTLQRVVGLKGLGLPIVVCNEEHRFFATGIMQELGIKAEVVLEPKSRNTAPAIALAALAAREGGDDPLLLVLPSDHLISPVETFIAVVERAAELMQPEALVTFGITPTRPETGYGYVRCGAETASDLFRVERFVEKPSAEKAEQLVSEGGNLWNSGIFLFHASAILKEFEVHTPDIFSGCVAAWSTHSQDLDFIRVGTEAFAATPSDSIDYAVMEHTEHAYVMPLHVNWNDLGSWDSFYEAAPHDGAGNSLVGDVIVQDTQDCYVHATGRLVATLGVKDLAIVETADAILVMDRKKSQGVKELLQTLRASSRCEANTHIKVYRPWGSYEVLVGGEHFQVKRLVVKEKAVLSLQMHYHRAEHWIVVSGTARVTVGENVLLLGEDESTYIPLGTMHRLENPGRIPLEIIEVQTGSYLGEDDIVRMEDTYGRV